MKQITEFEIYKDGEYFHGEVRQGSFLHTDLPLFFITCQSAAGSGVCTGILDFKHKNKGDLFDKIKAYAKRHSMKFKKLS